MHTDISEFDTNIHSIHSVLRERIVEHVFVGDVLRRLWQRGITDVEVMRSEFDAGGYDLVMARGKVVRHIQLKTMIKDGKAARTTIGVKLAEKPSGCVIWIIVDAGLVLNSYLWFGGEPGEPLPDISNLKVAKHSKGDATGSKNDRPNHRTLPRGRFKKLIDDDPKVNLDGLLELLFGPLEAGQVFSNG
ncbi:hypothetical protein [Brucella thiophenivorans]|nr:hypothetical protein [Brucella thiophenivorans]